MHAERQPTVREPAYSADTCFVENVRVGGQALPDGVLMRTDRAWAIARSNGQVTSGDLPVRPFSRIPVLRVVTGLGPALVLGLRGGRRGQPRQVPWRLLGGVVVAEAVVVGADQVISRSAVPHAWSPAIALTLVVLAIAVFRAVTPPAQWRFHGAEHKAVTAYERGIDLNDTAAVLTCSRVHPRCGTNLIAWLAVASVWIGRLSLVPQVAATLLAVAVIAEVLSIAARRATAWDARVLRAPGEVLQWTLTTSEPSGPEQEIGCLALRTCLERHAFVTGSDAPSHEHDEQDDQDDDEGADADIHDLYIPRMTASETTVVGSLSSEL